MEPQTTIQSLSREIETFVPSLTAAMRISGYNKIQLSELTGIPKSNVYKFYGEEISDPKLYYCAAMCKLLNYSLDEHFKISASADSRLLAISQERDTLDAEAVELRHNNDLLTSELAATREQLAFYKQQVEFKEAQMIQKDKLLDERAAFLRLKDRANDRQSRAIKLLSAGLTGCVLAMFFLLTKGGV